MSVKDMNDAIKSFAGALRRGSVMSDETSTVLPLDVRGYRLALINNIQDDSILENYWKQRPDRFEARINLPWPCTLFVLDRGEMELYMLCTQDTSVISVAIFVREAGGSYMACNLILHPDALGEPNFRAKRGFASHEMYSPLLEGADIAVRMYSDLVIHRDKQNSALYGLNTKHLGSFVRDLDRQQCNKPVREPQPHHA